MFGRSTTRRQQVGGGTQKGAGITQDDHPHGGLLLPPTIVSLSHTDDSSYDDSYDADDFSPSKQHSSSKKKKKRLYGGRRSVLDQARLCFVTGRLSRLIVHTALLVGVGAGSFLAGHLLLHFLQKTTLELDTTTDPALVLSHAGYAPKPVMMGYFFDGVASPRSFTHRVQRLTPPRHYHEWVDMLQPRLLEYSSNRKGHDNDNDDDRLLLPPLQYPMSDPHLQSEIETGSEDYLEEKPDITPNPEQCTPQYDWQTHNPVVCNVVHEHTMALDRLDWHPQQQDSRSMGSGHHSHHHHHSNGLRRRRLQETTTTLKATLFPEHFRLLAHGYWRETWMMQSPTAGVPELVAFKTLRYHHETTEYVLDKQRRDAVTSDRIASSPQSIHMHAYCGTSALYEYAPGGDLEKLLDRFEPSDDAETGSSPSFVEYYSVEERFRLAYNATAALTDLHTTEGDNRPTGIVHGDFKADQFVAVTPAVVDLTDTNNTPELHKLPHFKLGDYNLARMVYWNKRGHHPCVIEPDGNGGTFRAPEEYAEEHGRTEKVDIYSLGNLLYTILTGHWPFDDVEDVKGMPSVRDLVKAGHRPHINIDSDIRKSKNPQVRALVTAIDMCWKQDPHERASAQEVLDVLEAELL